MSQEFDRGRRLPPHVFTEVDKATAQCRVAVAPGFREHGDTHLRTALAESTHRIWRSVRNITSLPAMGDAEPTLFEPGKVVA
jgi:hypothetical protein